MPNPLELLEQRISSMVEGALARMVGLQFSPADIASRLTRAMSEGVRHSQDGKPFAPDRYALTFNADDAKTLLQGTPDLNQDLARGMLDVAKASDYLVFREPVVTIAVDPTLQKHEMRVVAWHSTAPLDYTQDLAPDAPTTGSIKFPAGAYLIVDGERHFALNHPVVNIGRRLDNQLILDDLRVSRTHCQIRVRDGRFELFDLGSSAGTQVNGRPIKHHILQTGDVIDLAGIKLVYGEDPGGPPDETPAYAPPFPPRPAGDQRTRVVKKDQQK
ncbi:MAG: DUF3662 domain-containing protein [Anaerolineales bacterium]|jgi:hypothetical protein